MNEEKFEKLWHNHVVECDKQGEEFSPYDFYKEQTSNLQEELEIIKRSFVVRSK